MRTHHEQEGQQPVEAKLTTESLVENIKKITEVFKISHRLGVRGAYGEVRRALPLHTVDPEPVALKIIPKNSPHLYREVCALRAAKHPKVIRLLGAYEDAQNVYLAMDLCQGGDLGSLLESRGGKLGESEGRVVMKQLVCAVQHLHEVGVVHCDIKPSNVMFAAHNNLGSLRLIDLGMAQWIGLEEPLTEQTGTMGYMAPEVLYEAYSEKCDVWSLGVLMFVILHGFNPFDPFGDATVETIERRVLKGFSNLIGEGYGAWFPDCISELISEEARDLIAQMLDRDASGRPSIHQVSQHPFFDISK